jgi:hypothetical protein
VEIYVQGFGGDTWAEPGVDGKIILKRIFRKLNVGVWTRLSWLVIETVGGQLCMR